MIEINKNRIKKAEIAIGIPSYNEANTISFVASQIDKGLSMFFKHKKSVIINVDNYSTDKTKRAFLNTKTKTPKIYLSTPKHDKGKGKNVHNFFLKTKQLEANAVALIDADIKSISPYWVKCLIEPIEKKYDFVSPIYRRNEYDGSITNHICYPMLYGMLGVDIRQPIGGEMGFSGKLYKFLLQQKWSNSVNQFGIDIFSTLYAIKGELNIGESDLGKKAHNPSAPKLDTMFLEVVETLFHFLSKNKKLWMKKVKVKKYPIVCEVPYGNSKHGVELAIDYKQLKEKALFYFSEHSNIIKKHLSQNLYQTLVNMFLNKKVFKIDRFLWHRIVYDMFYAYDTSRNKGDVIIALRTLYFVRIVSFIYKTLNRGHEASELVIRRNAKHFYKTRTYLLEKYKDHKSTKALKHESTKSTKAQKTRKHLF